MWRRSQRLDLPEGQDDASCCHLQKTLQQAPGFELAPCPAPWCEGCCPKQGLAHLRDTSRRCPQAPHDGTSGMKQELRTFQLLVMIYLFFSPDISEFLFQVLPVFKRRSRSEMQHTGQHTPSTQQPKGTPQVRQAGWEMGKKDPKPQQENFRWQEAKA